MSKRIIDVCCGSRMFWFDKDNPDVEFCDNRDISDTLCDGRRIEIHPDTLCDFTRLPFEDNTYYLAVFDPPHIAKIGDNAWMAVKYGKLGEGWREMLRDGFNECMRVLKPNGVLIFKWSEVDITVSEIIDIIGAVPLFGHKSGKLQRTHWMCFMK